MENPCLKIERWGTRREAGSLSRLSGEKLFVGIRGTGAYDLREFRFREIWFMKGPYE